MKYKVRLTCLITPWRFNYSEDMVVFSVSRNSVEVWATLEDATYLQRLNPQTKVEILYKEENVWFPLWFFRDHEEHLRDGQLMASNFYAWLLSKERIPYEPSYPLESQAPKFIYRPSTNFLIKKALHGMDKRGWKPCLGVTTAELVYTRDNTMVEQAEVQDVNPDYMEMAITIRLTPLEGKSIYHPLNSLLEAIKDTDGMTYVGMATTKTVFKGEDITPQW